MGIFYAEVSSGKFQTFTAAIQLSPELDLEGSTVPQPVRTNLNPNIRQDSTDWLNTSRSHGSFVKCPSLLSLSLQRFMFFWQWHRRTILRQTTTPVRRWYVCFVGGTEFVSFDGDIIHSMAIFFWRQTMRHRIRDSMSSLDIRHFFFHGVPSQEFRKISFTKNHSSEFRRPNIHWSASGVWDSSPVELWWNSVGLEFHFPGLAGNLPENGHL